MKRVGDPDLDQERFGSSLDLSDDGSLMVVMAEQQYQSGTHGIGYVIDISSDSSYNIESTLTRIIADAKYGYDVSLAKSSKDKIVVSSTDVSTSTTTNRGLIVAYVKNGDTLDTKRLYSWYKWIK